MTHKEITIVVPVYNRASLVNRTLDSIFSQDGIERAHIILVDNNSVDHTLEVLKEAAGKAATQGVSVEVASESIPGAAAARNRGVTLASTPWIMHFDSDDILHPGALRNILDAIDANPNAQIINWNISVKLPNGRTVTRPTSHHHLLWQHLVHSTLATQRYAVRRDLLLNVGAWDESLRQWDDYELGTRLLLAHPEVAFVATTRPLALTYFTPDSYTGADFSHAAGRWEEVLNIVERHLRDNGVSTHWVDVRRAMLAAEYGREGRGDFAEALRNDSLRRIPSRWHRFIWRLLRMKHSLYRRGTGTFATLFYSKNL